jgi:hypothetical protein
MIPARGQRGTRGHKQGQGRGPFQSEPPHDPPSVQGRVTHGGQWPSRVSTARPQQMRGQLHPNPRGMPGLLLPAGPADTMQRLALMMAVMVLDMPQVYSCHTSAGPRMSWDETVSEVRVCPPVPPSDKIKMTTMEDRPDPDNWRKPSAVHCQATQSVLTFLCSLDGRSRKVKFEKFLQPCGVQAAACWEAVESGKLKVGELEHPVIMNATRSHLGGVEDCSRGCGHQMGLLDRKVTQVLMESQVKKEWMERDSEEDHHHHLTAKIISKETLC